MFDPLAFESKMLELLVSATSLVWSSVTLAMYTINLSDIQTAFQLNASIQCFKVTRVSDSWQDLRGILERYLVSERHM